MMNTIIFTLLRCHLKGSKSLVKAIAATTTKTPTPMAVAVTRLSDASFHFRTAAQLDLHSLLFPGETLDRVGFDSCCVSESLLAMNCWSNWNKQKTRGEEKGHEDPIHCKPRLGGSVLSLASFEM